MISVLAQEAQYNIPSYTECFIAENLLREYIRDKNAPIKEAQRDANEWKKKEQQSKAAANITYDVRQSKENLQYLIWMR